MASNRNEIQADLESWDAEVNDNFEQLFETGFQVPNGPVGGEYEDDADLPDPTTVPGVFLTVNRDGLGDFELWYSNGSTWTLKAS